MIIYAKTSLEKARGFMGRNSIGIDEAMFFVNILPMTGFHMRTVEMPLGIVALDDGLRVIDAHVMEPEIGSWVTPENTSHVLEVHPDVAENMVRGQQPDWEKFGGFNSSKIERKAVAANNKRLSEFVKEISVEISPITKESIDLLDDLISEECSFDGFANENKDLSFRDKSEGSEDREYYGSDSLSDDFGSLSMAETVVETLWPKSSVLKNGRLFVRLDGLAVAGNRLNLQAIVNELRSNK